MNEEIRALAEEWGNLTVVQSLATEVKGLGMTRKPLKDISLLLLRCLDTVIDTAAVQLRIHPGYGY